MVTAIGFLEDRSGPGALSRCLYSLTLCSNLEIEHSARVHLIKVCGFMVPHRVGLKVVFGDTVVDSLITT
jgi:hypothetical protein